MASATANSVASALASVDVENLGAVAEQWRRLSTDITVTTDDWARLRPDGPFDAVTADLMVGHVRALAGRTQVCAELIDSIVSGVRRCRTELDLLASDWAAAQQQLASPALVAAYAWAIEDYQRWCRDAVQRTYNSTVERWEQRAALAVTQ